MKYLLLAIVTVAANANLFDSLFSNSNEENTIYVFHGSNVQRFYEHRANYLKNNILYHNPNEIVWFVGNSEESKKFYNDFLKNDSKYPNIQIIKETPNNFAEHLVCMMSKWFETKNSKAISFSHIVHSTSIPRMEHIVQQIHSQGLGGKYLNIKHRYCPVHFSLRHHSKDSKILMNHDFKWSSNLEHDVLENNVYNDVQRALYNTNCGYKLTESLKQFNSKDSEIISPDL